MLFYNIRMYICYLIKATLLEFTGKNLYVWCIVLLGKKRIRLHMENSSWRKIMLHSLLEIALTLSYWKNWKISSIHYCCQIIFCGEEKITPPQSRIRNKKPSCTYISDKKIFPFKERSFHSKLESDKEHGPSLSLTPDVTCNHESILQNVS